MDAPSSRVIAVVLIALILLPAPVSGQVPPGMKTYYNLKHGFQMHIPQSWKVELPTQDKAVRDGKLEEYVALLRAPADQAIVNVSENENEGQAAGAAYSRAAIAWAVRSAFQEIEAKVSLVWEDKARFTFPIAHYALFEVGTDTVCYDDRLVITFLPKGDPVFVLFYHLQDDGSGRGLPPGHVTHAVLAFVSSKGSYKTFEPTFHRIASSMRFFTPQQ